MSCNYFGGIPAVCYFEIFSSLVHMYECFVPFMIHFTLNMFDFEGVIRIIHLVCTVLGKYS